MSSKKSNELVTRVRYWGADGKLEVRKFLGCYHSVQTNGTLLVYKNVKSNYTGGGQRLTKQTVIVYSANAWHSAE